MTQLVVIVPTRLRPHAVRPLAQAFADTCLADTELLWCIDDCPHANEYIDAVFDTTADTYPHQRLSIGGPRRRLVGTLNHHAGALADGPNPPFAVGYLGDDHRPKTLGWDSAYLAALTDLGTGIVYGDDEHQGATLPTQMAMTTDIIRALGYLVPPCLTHMYCDNFWKDLGERAGCLTYLPDVTITHHHPGVGRGSWDASYHESNSADRYATDRAAYEQYRTSGYLDADVDTIQRLRGEAT